MYNTTDVQYYRSTILHELRRVSSVNTYSCCCLHSGNCREYHKTYFCVSSPDVALSTSVIFIISLYIVFCDIMFRFRTSCMIVCTNIHKQKVVDDLTDAMTF